jgi:hypothetical protein
MEISMPEYRLTEVTGILEAWYEMWYYDAVLV